MKNGTMFCRKESFFHFYTNFQTKKATTMRKEEIISVLKDLHKISGFRVSIHGTDFEEIASCPEEKLPFCAAIQENLAEYSKCLECDECACKKVKESGKAHIYKCRHGLVEVICPLYNFGTLTGYLMMGQVADENLDLRTLEAAIYGINKNHLLAFETARRTAIVRSDMLDSFVNIMTICAEYMTLTNVVPSNSPKLPELAKIYIHEHFSERLTIYELCKALGCSKSALLTAFKKEYGTTINNYICDVRINETKKMLATTSLSMSRIAEDTGFYDQSYFSKVFLNAVGITPSEYRREFKNK